MDIPRSVIRGSFMIRIFIKIGIILPDPNPCHWCIINHGITPTRGPVDERHLYLFMFSESRVPDSLRNRPLDYHMYIQYITTLGDGKLGDKNSYVWLGSERHLGTSIKSRSLLSHSFRFISQIAKMQRALKQKSRLSTLSGLSQNPTFYIKVHEKCWDIPN